MAYLFGVLGGSAFVIAGLVIVRHSVRIARFVLSVASVNAASPSGVANWYVKGHGVIMALFGLFMLLLSLRAWW
ncbi:MAG: uncharacterized membrane protein YsdA (DUF1294 family) [Halobacteriales archaeon]|jgi:uncharacterized membrane protein YsdA (DUF1294 family)